MHCIGSVFDGCACKRRFNTAGCRPAGRSMPACDSRAAQRQGAQIYTADLLVGTATAANCRTVLPCGRSATAVIVQRLRNLHGGSAVRVDVVLTRFALLRSMFVRSASASRLDAMLVAATSHLYVRGVFFSAPYSGGADEIQHAIATSRVRYNIKH